MVLPLESARQILLSATEVITAERIPLEVCWHRLLAERIVSDLDFPPFDRSPLDGYALLASEVCQASPTAPVALNLIETIPAGAVPKKTIENGTASRIMTGAPIPQGATGVVRLEDTEQSGDIVRLFAGEGAEKSICRQGEEIFCGEEVLFPGMLINPGVMGLLAALGVANPLVYRRPRVALLATGSEIVGIDQPLAPGKIRNSNSFMLSAQVSEAGGLAYLLGTAGDSVEVIDEMLVSTQECDLVVTTGGASVGDYDLIGAAFEKQGITILFERVGIKPGMPVIAGIKDNKLYIGLSGNPAAASIAFEQLVRPVLLKMGGYRDFTRQRLKAYLLEPYEKSSNVPRFIWAQWRQDGDQLWVKPLGLQGNGMLKSACHANALIIIPANSPPLAAGAEVEIELL
ncbi:MAG: moeA [Anaerosporomusa subterranea]|jgi:molybdopterin molybdotransferase|nr:moeA [Anaerosporomusa subterranea]